MNGGPLFANYVVNRVIDEITNEHQKVKLLTEKCDMYMNLYHNQRLVMVTAWEQNMLGDDIDMCGGLECREFFIVDDDTYRCTRCDNALCNTCKDAVNKCNICKFTCCDECLSHCNRCDANFCMTCFDDDNMIIITDKPTGYYSQYCSMACIPEHERHMQIRTKLIWNMESE
jgi:hypothetical protein